jgi:hypothetical protein
MTNQTDSLGLAGGTPAWLPIDITTPTKWHKFIGRQIGRTTIGFAAAYSTTAFFVGVELITGSSRGIAFSVGPLWLGFALLTPTGEKP